MYIFVISVANRGIGLALTKLFAENSIVYALCRSEFPDNELNENIRVINLDITDESAIAEFASKLNGENVAIDLLINNAGRAGGDENDAVSTDMKTLTNVFDTNIVGPMVLTLHLTAALRRSSGSAMIAISSRMGTHAMLDDYSAEWWPYSASKAALSMAVAAYAINEPQIRSISVHPGWVKTRMGGDDASIEASESAEGIKSLYENIASLHSGRMYNYDGTLMEW